MLFILYVCITSVDCIPALIIYAHILSVCILGLSYAMSFFYKIIHPLVLLIPDEYIVLTLDYIFVDFKTVSIWLVYIVLKFLVGFYSRFFNTILNGWLGREKPVLETENNSFSGLTRGNNNLAMESVVMHVTLLQAQTSTQEPLS